MTIAIVSADNSKVVKVGGKHIHQELFERGLRRGGNTVMTVYPDPKRQGFWSKVQAKVRTVFRLKKSFGVFSANNQRVMRSLKAKLSILEKKYLDILFCQDVVAGLVASEVISRWEKKPKIVLTLHGYYSREVINYGYFKESHKDRVFSECVRIEKAALKTANGVITVDTRIKEYIAREFDYTGPATIVFNAIDDTRFFPVTKEEQSIIRQTLGLDTEKTILLVARRLVKKNGVIYAVKAMDELKQRGKIDAFHLVIIGDGKEKENLKAYVEEKGLSPWVEFKGRIPHDQVDQYYKATSVLLMPSTKSDDVEEATSLSMLEGLICAKPVIASKIGGLKEVIEDGENGLLVDDKCPDQIADRLLFLLTNPQEAEALSQRAYEYTKKNHAFGNHALKILDIAEAL